MGFGETENNTDIFVIDANSCITVNVDFRGEYAGSLIKQDRLIPDIIEVE